MSIKIYNPSEEKIGKLSNLYDFQMKIDGKNWRNVSQYIYTEMIPSIVYKKNMMNSDNFNIYNDYVKFSKQSEIDLIKTSLLEILKVKFENPKMMEVLLSTGDSPIIYKSDNDILGTGKNQNGLNLLGKYMVQIRNQYIKSNIKKEEYTKKIEEIYNTYLVMKIFEDLIFSENIEDIQETYGNMSMIDIINSYGREKIMNKVPSKKVIMQIYTGDYSNSILEDYERDPIRNLYHVISESDKFSSEVDFKTLINRMIEIYNFRPYNVIFEYVKKNNLEKVAEYKKNKIKDDIFNLYIDNLINRKFPLLNEKNREIAKNQLLSKMSIEDVNKLKNEIYQIKDKANPIEKEINNIIENIKIPSDIEIEKAKNFNIFTNVPIMTRITIEKDENIKPSLETTKSSTLLSPKKLETPKSKNLLTPKNLKKLSKKNEEFMGDIMDDNNSVSSRSSSSTFDLSDSDDDISIDINEFKKILLDTVSNKKDFTFTYDINNDYKIFISYFLNNYTKFNEKNKKDLYDEMIKEINNKSPYYNIFEEFHNKYKISSKNTDKNLKKDIKPIIISPGTPSTNYYISYSCIKYSLEALSPIYFTGNLKIENLEFPTVSHYLLVKSYLLLPDIKNIEQAYRYIRTQTISKYDISKTDSEFISIDDAKEIYDFISYRKKYKKITELAKIGLDKKFEKSELLIDILLSTENKDIIWNDMKDHILGIARGKSYNINYKYDDKDPLDILRAIKNDTLIKEGENFIGKYLVTLRNTTRDTIVKDKKTYVINNNFNEFYNDKIFNKWVNLRVNDMCKTILKFKNYFNVKYNTGLEINYNLVKIINYNIYNFCNSKDNFKKIPTNDLPNEFILDIKKCLKIIDINILNFFWKYILSNISYLISHLKDPSFFNIKKIIYRVENILSKTNECKMFTTNNKFNCIILAFINLLVNISKIDEKKSEFSNDESVKFLDYKIDKNDINFVISIILNIPIDKIKDKKSSIKEIFYLETEIETEKPSINIYDNDFDISDFEKESEYVEDSDKESQEYDYPSDETATDNEYFNDDGNGDDIDNDEQRIITLEEKKVLGIETKNNIRKYLQENSLFSKDATRVSELIYQGSLYILNYKMDNKIKNNRINFFNNFK